MSKRALILAFFLLLFALHQDSWWKADATLVLGVLPISLAYHTVWTLLIALGWWLVGKYCWPKNLDDEDAQPVAPSSPSSASAAEKSLPPR
jgi:hypothetical protein